MAYIAELFGRVWDDRDPATVADIQNGRCPFLDAQCVKKFRSDNTITGVCTLKPQRSGAVICCPNRLYADKHRILEDVAAIAFGGGIPMVPGRQASARARTTHAEVVAVFGHGWGGELRLPQRGGGGAYFVDWILARLDPQGDLVEFVAVEVQSIDTTGSYRLSWDAAMQTPPAYVNSTAGLNWENVNKRILPQLIYKGHVLQREQLCRKGLFFVTPTQIYDRVVERLGGTAALAQYPLQSSSLTFVWYDVDPTVAIVPGHPRPLRQEGTHTTNIGQVAQAFVAPTTLPPLGVYESAIKAALTP